MMFCHGVFRKYNALGVIEYLLRRHESIVTSKSSNQFIQDYYLSRVFLVVKCKYLKLYV
jgi:hypothetical protein